MAGEAKSLSPRQCAVMDVALDTIKVSLYWGFGFIRMQGRRVKLASSTIHPLIRFPGGLCKWVVTNKIADINRS